MEENNIDINHNNPNWICANNDCEICIKKRNMYISNSFFYNLI